MSMFGSNAAGATHNVNEYGQLVNTKASPKNMNQGTNITNATSRGGMGLETVRGGM